MMTQPHDSVGVCVCVFGGELRRLAQGKNLSVCSLDFSVHPHYHIVSWRHLQPFFSFCEVKVKHGQF